MNCYVICVYWGARSESQERCSQRMDVFLNSLGKLRGQFQNWFPKTAQKSGSTKPISGVEDVFKMLKSNRKDIGNAVISDLGFSFSAWNRESQGLTASISSTCGCSNKYVSNSVVLTFEFNEEVSIDNLRKIFSSAINLFEAESGIVKLRKSNSDDLVIEEFKAHK